MERVWLRNKDTGGYFACPEPAVEDWLGLGWERSDPPPPDPSPVVAERIEWERQRSTEQQKPKTRRSGTTDKGESDG
ncbi:hypothetical protein ACFP2T_16485 [Plantactinospora solaniradicis]|uniref:Uncharacterized protein n=1 Tax=Plantactinospora solaniradicis TaxID=1723736 RepID=A0ABW1K7V2_9ACTN